MLDKQSSKTKRRFILLLLLVCSFSVFMGSTMAYMTSSDKFMRLITSANYERSLLLDRSIPSVFSSSPITTEDTTPSPSLSPTPTSTSTGTPTKLFSTQVSKPTGTVTKISKKAKIEENSTPTQQVTYAGYKWLMDNSGNEKWEPGPNYWTDDPQTAIIKTDGSIQLKLLQKNGIWYCPEVYTEQSMGYGTYTFKVDSSVLNIDDNIVFGAFLYDDRSADADSGNKYHREIDMVEISRWDNPKYPNTNFTVHIAPDSSASEFAYEVPKKIGDLEFKMQWQKDKVIFEGPPESGTSSNKKWEFAKNIPTPGQSKFRFNLWMFEGKPPKSGGVQSVYIKDFKYVPM